MAEDKENSHGRPVPLHALHRHAAGRHHPLLDGLLARQGDGSLSPAAPQVPRDARSRADPVRIDAPVQPVRRASLRLRRRHLHPGLHRRLHHVDRDRDGCLRRFPSGDAAAVEACEPLEGPGSDAVGTRSATSGRVRPVCGEVDHPVPPHIRLI